MWRTKTFSNVLIRRANIALHGFLRFLNPNRKLSRNFLQPIKWQCKGGARGIKDLFKHSEKSAYLWSLVFSLWLSSIYVTHRCLFIDRRETTDPFAQEWSSYNVTGFTQKIDFNSQENLISCEKFFTTSARRRTHFMFMITSAVNLSQTFYQSSGFSDSGPNRFDILGVSLHWLLIAQCGPHIFCLHLNWSLLSDLLSWVILFLFNKEWINALLPSAAEILYHAAKSS